MSLEDIRNAAERDQQAVVENEGLLAESAGVGGQEIGPEAHQQPSGENHAPVEATTGEDGQSHHDSNNVVDMRGNPVSPSFQEKLAAMGPDREPTKKMVRYVGGLSRALQLTPPDGYEGSFNACRLFLNENAYAIEQYKRQRQAARAQGAQAGNAPAGNDLTPPSSPEAFDGPQPMAGQGQQQTQQPMTGPATGLGAAIGAISGLGAGIVGLGTGLVKFPFQAGVKGLQSFRKANMDNALDTAHESAGHFTETVIKLMNGNATQEDVKAAYSEFQKHYKNTLSCIDRVGHEALEKTPERLAEVRQKLNAISERVEAGGISKLEEDSRFKELGTNLREAFENFCKFFENLFNRILGRSSAAPSMG